MIHTIVYLGRYNLNLERLRSHRGSVGAFIMLDEGEVEKPAWKPSPKADGIAFGYLEKGKEDVPPEDKFHCVSVGDIILENPVPLNPARHTDGKKFGPSASQFGDVSAKNLLADAIEKNPNQAPRLEEIQREFFGK